jgi:heme/copper-type cytochrome/quinol oxidase subunit 1
MVTWLTRSLIFIVGGAVLAFAVTTKTITYHSTKHGATMDVHTVGAILLLVGVFDLLLNFGVSMYLRDTGQPLDPYVANPATAALGTPTTVTRQVYATTPNVATQRTVYAEPAQPVYVEQAQPVYVEQGHTPSHARPIHETQPIPIDPQL